MYFFDYVLKRICIFLTFHGGGFISVQCVNELLVSEYLLLNSVTQSCHLSKLHYACMAMHCKNKRVV